MPMATRAAPPTRSCRGPSRAGAARPARRPQRIRTAGPARSTTCRAGRALRASCASSRSVFKALIARDLDGLGELRTILDHRRSEMGDSRREIGLGEVKETRVAFGVALDLVGRD